MYRCQVAATIFQHLTLAMLLLVGSGRALGTVWRLPPGATLSVGRKGVPLLIEDDNSVSRKHASISAGGADDGAGIVITDNGSKFGVHINGDRCPANTPCPVGVGDRVTFGAQDSTFRLCHCPVAICIASMSSDMAPLADAMRARAAELGMSIATDVAQCSHLLVAKLAVTSTLVRALVLGRRIVSPSFVHALETLPLVFKVDSPSDESVDEYTHSMRFLPETGLPDSPADSPIDLDGIGWAPDERRHRLFQGKVFVFANAGQRDKYRALVEAAQGASADLAGVDQWLATPERTELELGAQSKASADRMLVLAKETGPGPELAPADPVLHLILPPPDDTAAEASAVSAFVCATAVALGVRPMSESEISLAVLFVSCKHHANAALRDEDSTTAVAPVAPRHTKSRKRARISSFWETAIAADAAHEPPTAPLDDAPQQPRRKRNMGDFWSDAVQDATTTATATDTITANDDAPASTGPPPSTDRAPQPVDATPAGELPAATVVPLVKPKASRVLRAPDNAAVPNFKQFRKTVHAYQLEHRY
ncbi:hypothetical protein H4R19_005090 [Coemansia spiralis]|nr:hypothetical protein H4R19_005090 [Coemansia spiralis]